MGNEDTVSTTEYKFEAGYMGTAAGIVGFCISWFN